MDAYLKIVCVSKLCLYLKMNILVFKLHGYIYTDWFLYHGRDGTFTKTVAKHLQKTFYYVTNL